MRTNASPLPTQDWLRIGLNRWHQAIVRREAERLACNVSRNCSMHLEWNQYESIEAWRSGTSTSAGGDSHVVFVDRQVIVKEWDSWNGLRSHRKNLEQVRLLWDWRPTGRTSLDWATEIGFSGVINDFCSLGAWCRVIFERIPYRFSEPHPILSKLTFPSLTKPHGPASVTATRHLSGH
jgi:hypothetical protein